MKYVKLIKHKHPIRGIAKNLMDQKAVLIVDDLPVKEWSGKGFWLKETVNSETLYFNDGEYEQATKEEYEIFRERIK